MITDDTQPADFANGHAGSAVSCEEFANSLYDRYTEIGDMALLDEILDLEREALRLRPEGDPDRAVSCGNLALTLRARFDQTGQPALLDEALELEREALRLRPEGHMDRADSCANLAITLTRFFEQTGHTALLDEALELGREALSLRPEGHSDRADLCANLAVTLNTCFKQTGHTTLLDEALEFEREAMRLRPGGHPNRADSCINLAVTLKTRFRQTGHSTLLDEALELEREALHLRPEGHPNRAHSCGSLAKTLKTRFEQTGHTALLDEALELEREALSLRPEGHPDRAFSCGQLASTLGRFFEQTGHTALLDEVFELQREALRLRPEGHLRRSNSCVNLAVALKLRFDQNGHTVLLEEALELEREALRLRPEGHPRHAFLCANLAATLERRFNQTGDTALLDEARSYCTHAIKESAKSPEDHVRLRLALAHILCLATYPSGNPSTAVAFLLEIAQNPAGMIPVFYEIPYVLRMCVRAVVSDEDHAYLLAVYQALIDMLPEMGSAVLPKPLRVRRWSKAGNLPLEAFLQAMKVNGRATGLELLEQGRAVLWSQALAFQGTHLQGLPNERKTQLQTLLQSMNIAVDHGDTLHSDSAVRDRIHAAYTQLQQLLTEIRASPGLGRFMRGPLYSELLQVASKNPVIVVAASEATCHALVISSPSAPPTHLVLNQIAATDLDVLGHDIRGLDLNVRAMSGLAVATEERGICIDRKCAGTTVQKLHQALRSLWTDIVKPILECLGLRDPNGRDRPRVHWCPVGALVFLPIHAAGAYSQGSPECCSDYVVSSYTPTLSALRRARMDLVPMDRESLVLLAASAAESSASPGLSRLDNVRPEVTQVTRIARDTGYVEVLEFGDTSAAKLHEVIEALPGANIVHLACHGVQDQKDPLSSGFCLADGKLTVSYLMDIRLDRAFLAFLSACETAKGDKNQPDQVIHLAAAMLFCGFRSVVATMWSIEDEDGPAVAREFYAALLAKEVIDADAVAYALDEAVSKLRRQDVSPTRWAPFIHVGA